MVTFAMGNICKDDSFSRSIDSTDRISFSYGSK